VENIGKISEISLIIIDDIRHCSRGLVFTLWKTSLALQYMRERVGLEKKLILANSSGI